MQKSPRVLKVNKKSVNIGSNSINPDNDTNIMNINIGGKLFQTYKATLQRKPGTILSSLGYSHPSYQWNKNEYFFDRHPGAFESILEYLRTGKLHMPTTMCSRMFAEELQFWGIRTSEICDCCWHTYCHGIQHEATYARLKKCHSNNGPVETVLKRPREKMTISEKIWLFLEYPEFSRYARTWGWFNILLILISTLTHSLFTLEELREPDNSIDNSTFANITNPKLKMMLATKPRNEVFYAELSFLFFFTIDFAIRLATCPHKWWFLKSLVCWVDILYLVPGWIVIVPYYWYPSFWKQEGRVSQMTTLHMLMVIRIFRLFSLTRYYRDLLTMVFVIRSSAKELLLLFAIVIIATIIFGSMIFMAELYVEDSFRNSFSGYWWALITMSTVGYGDMYPVSVAGYIVGSMCTLTGLIFLGIPIAIITNKFNAYHSYRRRNHIMPRVSLQTVAPINGI